MFYASFLCNFHPIFIPFLLDYELLQHLDGSETSHFLAYKCYFKDNTDLLSLFSQFFHSFTEQILMNTYCVLVTFIDAENTVVIQMKIIPAPAEPRMYGWGTQNIIGNTQFIQNRKLQCSPLHAPSVINKVLEAL